MAAVAPYRWVMLALMTVLQLGVSMPQQTPAAIGPVLSSALALSRPQLGLLTSAIWGGMLLGMLPSGLLADRYGERRVIGAGTLLLAGFLLLAAQATSFSILFGTLLLAAIGAAASSPGGTKVIAAWFRPGQRGMALGVRQTGVTFAGVLAAVILPPIALKLGWQAAFRTVAIIALLALLVFWLLYREPAPSEPATSISLNFGGLVRNRTFIVGTAYAWVFMGALACSVSYLGISLHEGTGLSVVAAGLVLAVMQVGGVAGRIGWGLLSDRSGRRTQPMILAGLLAIVSALGMASVHGQVPIVALGGLAFVLGASTMGWNALYITLVTESVPARNAATALGAGLTVSFTGMFVGAPLFGLLADLTGAYTVSWAALAGWSAIGTLLALATEPAPALHMPAPPTPST